MEKYDNSMPYGILDGSAHIQAVRPPPPSMSAIDMPPRRLTESIRHSRRRESHAIPWTYFEYPTQTAPTKYCSSSLSCSHIAALHAGSRHVCAPPLSYQRTCVEQKELSRISHQHSVGGDFRGRAARSGRGGGLRTERRRHCADFRGILPAPGVVRGLFGR